MSALVQWVRNKIGRITTACGGVAMIFDAIPSDISPVSDYVKGLFGAKWLALFGIVCFVVSHIRHQQVANRVSALQQQLSSTKE